MKITFVVAVNDRSVFEGNFLRSDCVHSAQDCEIIVQEGFSSAAEAYNAALDRASHDLVVFCHQDLFLPESWIFDLQAAVEYLEVHDPSWGVLGAYGETLNDNGRGYIYSSGRSVLGRPFAYPLEVQTLDEIVLIVRRSSGLRFDSTLPYFHLYGADICLRAAQRGMKSYAIPAFCVHNTNQALVLPREFYRCYRHVKRTWKNYLPVQTTCIRITRFDISLYRRRLAELYLQYIRRIAIGGKRVANINDLLTDSSTALRSNR
jgi:hypothetical protein